MSSLGQGLQFEPTDLNIKQFLKLWDISPNYKWKPIDKGHDNASIIITSPEQDYILRIYRLGSVKKEEIDQEVAFMNYLNRNKMPVPKVFLTDEGDSFGTIVENEFEWNGILMEKALGEHLKEYTKETIQEIAKILALIHLLSLESPGMRICKYEDIIRFAKTDEIDLEDETENTIKEFLAQAKQFQIEINDDLPKGLIHRDITKGNTLFQGNSLSAVLDFSSLTCGYFVEDIGVVMWGIIHNHISRHTPISLLKDFLTAYGAIRPIKPEEYKYLDQFVKLRNYVLATEDYVREGDVSDEMHVDSYLKKLE
jgi:homoserine kinase type II